MITFMWPKVMQLFLQESIAPNPLAKEELNFLARLMGGMEIKKPSGPEPGFRLNLFTTDEEEEYVLKPVSYKAYLKFLSVIITKKWPL